MVHPTTTIEFTSPDELYDREDQAAQWNAAELRDRSGIVADPLEELSTEAIMRRLGMVTDQTAAEAALTTPETTDETRRSDMAPAIGSVMCGDCGVDVNPGNSCFGGHLTVRKNGKRVING